jgi:hypothetical protein
METTVQEVAFRILSALETEYTAGYMPDVRTWCKFVLDYTGEHNTSIDGMFDRVYRAPRKAQKVFTPDYDFFSKVMKYTASMTQDSLRMATPAYIASYCVRCGEPYVDSENSLHLCDKCYFTTVHKCSICGEPCTFDDDTLESAGGYLNAATYRRIGGREKIICKSCASDVANFVKCDCCGAVVHRGETGWGKTISSGVRTGQQFRFCKACITDHAVVACNDCGAYVLKGEIVQATGLCMKCHLDSTATKKQAEIHSHTYKPKLVFISTTPVIDGTYGLEIEVDDGHHSSDLMEYLEELKELIRLKSDGSLNDGFEIVTFPMTLDCHKTIVPYEDMFRRLHDDGYTSHENSTCGLHIHVGRTGFGNTARSQNPAIGRFIWLTEVFKDQIRIFSRRKDYRYCQFYGFSASMSPKQMLTYARNENRHSRYKAVNLQNAGTIEVRIFKGSLKTSTVLASIELCDYMRKYVIKNKDDSAYTSALTWNTFISGVRSSEYPNLKNYLVTKRLI